VSVVAEAAWRDAWVLYRDAHVLVIDKPAGVASHPADAVEVSDVATRLAQWLGKKPSMLHAIDREASGVMVFALEREASRNLAAQFERAPKRSVIVGTTARPRGIPHEVVVRRGDRMVLRLVDQKQLRRLLAEGGAPAAGDGEHGGAPAVRLMVHFESMELRHPSSGARIAPKAPIPSAFERWLDGTASLGDVSLRVRDAAERRYALATRSDTDAYRLAHGAGDELPGVEIDVYGEHAVVSLASEEALTSREAIYDAVAGLGFRGVYAKLRPKQANTLVDTRRENVAPPEPVRGKPLASPSFVRELGVEYAVRLGDGLSTGIFLDQRAGRGFVRDVSAGKRVLNLFAYHGAFTVAAVAGGAARTITVDSSGIALERARENIEHQGVPVGAAHVLVKGDATEWLTSCRERFDWVVLDPPSYSTTKSTVFRAERDFQRLAALAFGVLATGGTLLASTNLRRMNAAAFRRVLAAAARDARREVAKIRAMPLPLDHPPPPGEPWHLKRELVTLAD